jgi:myo-inositol-1(or 4)-monophosphatase
LQGQRNGRLLTERPLGDEEGVNSSDWLAILSEAARAVAASVGEARGHGSGLELRDFKHLLDESAQTALVNSLMKSGVPSCLVSEEGDEVICGWGPVVIADPIDGTTNLSRGLRPAVTSLAVSTNGMQSGVEAAVVADLYTGDSYTAARDGGAAFNGVAIRVAKPRPARIAVTSLGMSKTPKLDRLTPLLNNALYLRMLGSSATELCLLAAGSTDAHVDIRGTLRATDVAASLLILSEAGGVYAVNRTVGGDLPLTRESKFELLAASSQPLLEELLPLTRA